MDWLKEFLYIFYVFFLSQSTWFVQVPEGHFSPYKQNIVLVSGFNVGQNALIPMKKKFKEAGFNVVIPHLGRPVNDLEKYGHKLCSFLDTQKSDLSKKESDNSLQMYSDTIFLGHSMGGLIILSAIDCEPAIANAKIITVATPLKGTPMAYTCFFFKACRQSFPDSNWLKELHTKLDKNSPRLFQVQARADELVSSRYSALKGFPILVVPITGHASLLIELSPGMLKKVLESP